MQNKYMKCQISLFWAYIAASKRTVPDPRYILCHLEDLNFLTYIAKLGIFKWLVQWRNVIGKIWNPPPILDLPYNIGICTNIAQIHTIDNQCKPPLPSILIVYSDSVHNCGTGKHFCYNKTSSNKFAIVALKCYESDHVLTQFASSKNLYHLQPCQSVCAQ